MELKEELKKLYMPLGKTPRDRINLAFSIHLADFQRYVFGYESLDINQWPSCSSLSLHVFKLNHNLTSLNTVANFTLSKLIKTQKVFVECTWICFSQLYLYIQQMNLWTSLPLFFRLCCLQKERWHLTTANVILPSM